jgi:hypothetical protein
MLCFGLALLMGEAGADEHKLPPGVWQDLDKIRVAKFVAHDESRSEVIKKLDQALHAAAPGTKIKISFSPPPASDNINEEKYTRSMHISVYNCTMVDLLQLVATYDVDWKVRGNKVVGTQARTD